MSLLEKRAALRHIVQLYEKWDKPGAATIWRAKLAALEPPPK